jgi:hypothetical protein
MGFFGWHQCAEPGCETWLFIPLFAKPRAEDGIEDPPGDAQIQRAMRIHTNEMVPSVNPPRDRSSDWATYLATLSSWYEPHDASKTRCPKHHPHKAENLSSGLDAVPKPP